LEHAIVPCLSCAVVMMLVCPSGGGGVRVAGPVQVDGRVGATQGERRVPTPAGLDLSYAAHADGYAAVMILACDATAVAGSDGK
jgi:hypothetical protein